MVKAADNGRPRDHLHGKAHTQAEPTGALRAGWNDAAWGRERRTVPDHLIRWYELGYAGGLIFRQQRQTRPGDS